MTQPYVTRFAPSPNGYLHLGHAFSALTAFEAARAAGGTMLLRIDDIDSSRAREEYIQAIYEDLKWLGITWPRPARMQSKHLRAYDQAAKTVMDKGVTYPCFCVRKTLKVTSNGHYAGTCRHLTESEIAARLKAGEQAAIRLNVNDCMAALKGKALSYEDSGTLQNVELAALEDAIIIRKDIGTSYLLSCVVDDAAQNISHVVRGRDIQPLTGLQVLLQHLLGLPTPLYHHHGLISGEMPEKLSKSKGAPSLRDARAAGATPQDILDQLGFAIPAGASLSL